MSNVLKSIGKTFKKVLKKAMPIIMVAAVIYTAGAAAGAWGVGAGGMGAAGGELGALGASGAAPAATSGLAASSGAAGGALGSTATGLSAGVGGASMTAAATPTLAIGGAGTGATVGASLEGAANAMLGFVESHPAATMMAGSMLQSAFTPTEAETQAEIERNRRENSTFYGVGYGGQGPGLQMGQLGVLANAVGSQRQQTTPGIIQRFKGA